MNIIGILKEMKHLIDTDYRGSGGDYFLLNDYYEPQEDDPVSLKELAALIKQRNDEIEPQTITLLKAIRQVENLMQTIGEVHTVLVAFKNNRFEPYKSQFLEDGVPFEPHEVLLAFTDKYGGDVRGLPHDIKKYAELYTVLHELKKEGILKMYQDFILKLEAMCIMAMPFKQILAEFHY